MKRSTSQTAIVVRSTLFNALFYVNIVVMMLVFVPILLMPYRATLWLARLWARVSLWLLKIVCGLHVEFRGLENLSRGPALVASKHQSFLEAIALLLHVRDFSYVLKRELTWIPLFGWYLWSGTQIAIDRGSGRAALAQLNDQATRFLDAGRSLILFPEGTRRPVGAPPLYKGGIGYLYEATQVPCVPVALNTGTFWPRRSFRRLPGRCIIEFLPPIQPGLPREEFMTTLQMRIETRTDALVAQARTDDVLSQSSSADHP